MAIQYKNMNESIFNETFDRSIEHEQNSGMNTTLIFTVVIAVMAVRSTTGNLVTILAIMKNTHLQTKSNMFILSLAFSDLVSGLIASPLWLYRNTWGINYWALGQITCKLFFLVDESTSYCTSLHIAAFAVWRYSGIKWPRKVMFAKISSIQWTLGVFWMISLVCGIANSFFMNVSPKNTKALEGLPSCSVKPGKMQIYYQFYLYAAGIFYLMPFSILFISSCLIVKELIYNPKFKRQTGSNKEKRAVYQLTVIAALFLVGYLPSTVFIAIVASGIQWSKRTGIQWKIAAYMILRLSECFNPMSYNVTSEKLRKASKNIVSSLICCECPKNKISDLETNDTNNLTRSTNITN